ncbi:lysosomal acid lipase-related [Anaeramoeba flamelloides]|uniref:Lysosomal acid lipase-related n=1 Tax=Anaeramoeba flamelloides TaxID=1746091 RepID=A0ABQ8Y7Y1_9EUKA|nr:lysosomal acid lipase-related [Anaeramoeba flamelloides]
MVTSKGYPCELLNTQTKDGWTIGIQHMSNPGGKPVLLWHGFVQNAATWTSNFPGEDLVYSLYDQGFDVYLGNSRCTKYSKKSSLYDPNKDPKDYWNQYDFDNMPYDLEATFDFILDKTGFEKLGYVGHSQGTTMMFCLLTTNPEYAKKINLFVALAPPVYVSHSNSPIILLTDEFWNKFHFKDLFEMFGVWSISAGNKYLDLMFSGVCEITPLVCENILFMISGWDFSNLNQTRLPVYAGHPESFSIRDLTHGLQVKNTGVFKKYDYGYADDNYYHYGQNTPPIYDLNKISLLGPKFMIYYGGKDLLVDPFDVEHYLLPNLNPELFYQKPVYLSHYTHLDFVWGINAHTDIYDDVVDALKKQNY